MIKYNNINTEKLMHLVNKALDRLYLNEDYIFKNDSSERNMVFHFAKYLSLELFNSDFNAFNIDCEYNRNKLSKNGIKTIKYNIKNQERRVFPDLIIHKRGTNEKNILAIEFKKWNNKNKKNIEYDIEKLKAFTSQNGTYKYKLGLFICFEKERRKVKITTIIDGNMFI